MNYFYSTGIFDPLETIHSMPWNVYNFQAQVPETADFWAARTAFETAMTKVMVAQNDEEFDQLYQTLLDTSHSNGLTQEMVDKINDAWKNDTNKDYMENIEEFLKKNK